MDEQISVHSVTGVDLTLHIAGPGNRSYAFVIDWHIRLLLSGAWLLLAVYVMRLSLNARSQDGLLSLLPAFGIYFLYHPILEIAMRGRTPGKRIAGIRIVTRTGGAPGTAALLIRNVFRLIDSLPALYALGLVTCFVTANRVRIGDMAAGTLLVLDEAAAAKSLARLEVLTAGSALPLDTLELVDQILERWPSLGSDNRRRIAATLLARVEPGCDARLLAGLGETELHARLSALLNAGAATSAGAAGGAAATVPAAPVAGG
jgi:uncharacterized RDD family membrane protein YckC